MTQPYLAGNPVYNGGSSHPTMGTVDPMGYIERTVRSNGIVSPKGNDGQSDRRSGLAQAALSRLRSMPNGNQSYPAPTNGASLSNGVTGQSTTPTLPATTFGHVVNEIGQLLPTSHSPVEQTANALLAQQQQQEMMQQAAQARLEHHTLGLKHRFELARTALAEQMKGKRSKNVTR